MYIWIMSGLQYLVLQYCCFCHHYGPTQLIICCDIMCCVLLFCSVIFDAYIKPEACTQLQQSCLHETQDVLQQSSLI